PPAARPPPGRENGPRAPVLSARTRPSLPAARHVRTETVATVVAGDRAVVELMAHITVDGHERPWPAAIVADSAGDQSITFRTYLSLWVFDGRHHPRAPILRPGTAPPAPPRGA